MYSFTLSLTSSLGRGQRHAQVVSPREGSRYHLYGGLGGPLESVWTGAGNLSTTGKRSPDRPDRSGSLCRLSCPVTYFLRYWYRNFKTYQVRFALYDVKREVPCRLSLVETYCRVETESDGTRRSTGGEVKGKEANGVGSQQSCTVSEHGLSSITTADAHTSAASSRLNWHPRRYKWTRPFRWKTKSGFCACAITFSFHSTTYGYIEFWASSLDRSNCRC